MPLDKDVEIAGSDYEQLMMRAWGLKHPSASFSADRRLWYLLFYIREGVDLRQTGYREQFNRLKRNVSHALKHILELEPDVPEAIALQKLIETLDQVSTERDLSNVIKQSLEISMRKSW